MTVMEALNWGGNKLKENLKEENTSPLLDAQIILAKVLEVPTAYLFTHFDEEIKNSTLEKFQKLIQRRGQQEPVAYITGEKEFYKRTFFVNPNVLIPRPTTETLIDLVLKEIKNSQKKIWFADIGTGSGAIAITLAAETGQPVIASDISNEALAVTKQNAELNHVAELIDFRRGDLLSPLIKIFQALKNNQTAEDCSHLIICANLPYLTNNQWLGLNSGVKNFEPALALTAGHDCLDLYLRLLSDLKKHGQVFPPVLSLFFEIDPGQTIKIISMIKHDFPETKPQIIKDLEGFDLVVIIPKI